MTEVTTSYAEFDESAYASFRRSLIRKSARGSTAQRQFLASTRESNRFLKYMNDEIGLPDGVELEPLAERMSEAEFGNPPANTEQRLFDAWSGLTPRIACRTAFWGWVTYRHIAAGRIESSFLAANGAGNVSGAQRIDAALAAAGDVATPMVDRCVRTVLRRLGGLPEARGNRSLYVNCPLARAWWRERLIREVAGCGGPSVSAVRAVVHPSGQQYWEELVTFMVSRNSVFGSAKVRNALIHVLAEKPVAELRAVTKLKILCRSICSIQASIELSILPANHLRVIMRDIVQKITSR